mmetsp:Transcript_85754/g.135436  ORF Transcript_85754/g.135436 Transcript_85754/m.135436 type:complete len:230 (+) Transcript_85754:897-1586(+)
MSHQSSYCSIVKTFLADESTDCLVICFLKCCVSTVSSSDDVLDYFLITRVRSLKPWRWHGILQRTLQVFTCSFVLSQSTVDLCTTSSNISNHLLILLRLNLERSPPLFNFSQMQFMSLPHLLGLDTFGSYLRSFLCSLCSLCSNCLLLLFQTSLAHAVARGFAFFRSDTGATSRHELGYIGTCRLHCAPIGSPFLDGLGMTRAASDTSSNLDLPSILPPLHHRHLPVGD